MHRKSYVFTVIIPLAFVSVLLIVAWLTGFLSTASTKTVEVQVVGQSIIGEQYSKRLFIANKGSFFSVSFERSSVDEKKYGENISASKDFSFSKVNAFLKKLDEFEDEGDSAICCDHPFTIITIARQNGEVIVKKLSKEAILVEDYFQF